MSCALEPNDKQQTDQSVWYRVTIQTGKEIKFYGAHKLKVPAECIICDFISHVKSHSHNIPEDSENCSISAIRNRLSFDLNEPPLGRSSKINQLGSIISEAIIIYVYDHKNPMSQTLARGLPLFTHYCRRIFNVGTNNQKSIYGAKIEMSEGTFGVLNELSLDCLNGGGSSFSWDNAKFNFCAQFGFSKAVQEFVCYALRDCLTLSRLRGEAHYDSTWETFSPSEILLENPSRKRILILRQCKNYKKVIGVCYVCDINSVGHVVDYMLDLRNSLNIGFVFGLLTNCDEWRILWFEDTNRAAEATSEADYQTLCTAMASDSMESVNSDDVHIRSSRIYKYNESALVEALVSWIYKVTKSPVLERQKFIDLRRRYVLISKTHFKFAPLPAALRSFSYRMPSQLESEFYMLKYFRRGNDGSVGVACTPSGRLCVMKFPVDEKKARMLGEEMRSWNSLWQTDCFICRLKDYRLALVMPFCLHVRVFAHGKRFFCGLNDWNGANRETSEIVDDEVCEFNRIDKSDLQKYQDDPLKAAEKALTRMINQNVEHQSLKWSRIALMPRFDSTAVDATVKLCPIMIDMTHNRPISNYRAMNVQQMLARLITRD